MIDWDLVLDLRNNVFEDDFAEVVDVFIDECREGLIGLQSAISGPDIESAFHFLKSSALNFGFTDFADLCHQGEQAAATGEGFVDVNKVVAVFEVSLEAFLSRSTELGIAA